jgi:hypothetical protein
MASENSYTALQRRIDNLTARTTPVAEPGRHIEKYLNMLKIMFGYLIDFAQHSDNRARYEDYAEQTQSKITRLRTAFHMNNKNTYLNNHRVSNNIANRVADQAQALYDDIVRYNESKFQHASASGSAYASGSEYEENDNPKRARTESSRKRRGNRKSRKTRKTRKTRKMRR